MRRPAFPIALFLLAAPTVAVLQFRWLAALATIALLAAVLLHRRIHGALPWPRPAPALAAALALLGWLLLSALWAAEPGRAAATALSLGGLILLGAGAARAMEREEAAALSHLARCLVAGLALGIALAIADVLSGHAIRAGVRGLAEAPPTLVFGLKPAVSAIAVLLPVALALPVLPRAARAGLAAAGLAAAVLIPAEAARIAAVAGLAALLVAMLAGPWLARAAGAGLGLLILAAPIAVGLALPRLPPLEPLPPSAAQRILIWEFAVARIAERPWLGWGGEASRTIPGGRETFGAAALARHGLASPASQAWFARPQAQRLPLHTHNAALQLWLELGAMGAALGAAVAATLGALAARAGPMRPAATGAFVAAAIVGMLSFGVWQEWWIGLQVMLVVTLVALTRRAALARGA